VPRYKSFEQLELPGWSREVWRHNERCLTASEHPINVTTWTIDFGPDLVNRGVWAKVGSDSYGLGQSSGVILVSMQVVSSVVDLPTPNGDFTPERLCK
jgi:hypothetical protein